MNFKIPKELPLYISVWLTHECHIELAMRGIVSQEALDRLVQFLRVTGELWGLQVEVTQEDNKG